MFSLEGCFLRCCLEITREWVKKHEKEEHHTRFTYITPSRALMAWVYRFLLNALAFFHRADGAGLRSQACISE